MLVGLCLIFFLVTFTHFFLFLYKFSPIAWEYTGFYNKPEKWDLSILKRTVIPYSFLLCFPYIFFRVYLAIDVNNFTPDLIFMVLINIFTIGLIILRKKTFNFLRGNIINKTRTNKHLPEIIQGPKGWAYKYYAVKALLIQHNYPEERIGERDDKVFFEKFCQEETKNRKKRWPHDLKNHKLNSGSFKTQYNKFRSLSFSQLVRNEEIISFLFENREFDDYPEVYNCINENSPETKFKST